MISNNDGKILGELWHRHSGHIHHEALKTIIQAITGIPKLSIEHEDVCKGCAEGKFSKRTFPKSYSRAKGVLELVH